MAAPVFNLGNMQGSTDWTVDPKTQTVAGQLESVIKSDSPLMQQARARALEAKNKSGLLNSSMATGAADSALYDTALQIATPDANTFASAAQTNAAAKNTFASNANQFTQQGKMAEYGANANDWGAQQEFGRTTQRDATQQGYNLANMAKGQEFDLAKMSTNQQYTADNTAQQALNESRKLATQQGYNLQNMTAQQVNDMAKLNAQTTAAKDVADIEARYKNLTQGSVSATSILNNMQGSLDKIIANKDITNDRPDPTKPVGPNNMGARDRLTQDIKANALEALQMIGTLAGDVDMGSFVSGVFGGSGPIYDPRDAGPPAPTTPTTPPAATTPPAGTTPLSPTQKATVEAEARRLATEKGISPEEALYQYSLANGIPPNQVDSLMGYPAGTTQAWINSNTGPRPAPAPVVTAPRPTPAPAPAPVATPTPAPAPAPTQGPTEGTAAWQQSIVSQAQAIAASTGVSGERAMYDAARQAGWTGFRLDTAMGWPGGTANNWATQNGLPTF